MTSSPTGLGPARSTDTALDAVRSVTGAVPAVVTVTAVVVTRGRSPHLEATLAALRTQSHAPHAIVVVDVDTAPSTAAHRGLTLNGARYVAASRSRSFGDAVNAALADLAAEHDAAGGPATESAGGTLRGTTTDPGGVSRTPHVIPTDPGGVRGTPRAIPSGSGSTNDMTSRDRAPDWLWLLHDDSAPEPGALAALVRSVEHSATVAVAGPKQRLWESDDDGTPLDPAAPGRGLLLQVGYTVSPSGRRMTGLDDTEIDQGQHDAREDVLAVGLAGALVKHAVWRELGGTDAEYGPFGDSLEFCRRVHLAGHRVIVVPSAVVRHAQVSLRDPATRSRRRRAQLRYRLVAAAPWLLGWVMLAVVAGAPFLAAYRLAVKQPAAARDELAAPAWMLLGLGSVLRARRRAARTATQPRRVLRPLLGTWRQSVREFRERRLARADARAQAPDDLDHADLRRLAARRRTVLTLVLLVATGFAAAVFGPVLGTLADGGRLVGGSLLPASADTGQVWTAATSGWIRTGLGQAGPGDPLLLTLTVLATLAAGSLQAGVNALFVAALPLAALGGWAASGALTRSVGVRAVAALAWAAAPPLLGALSDGLLGAVVAHLALPWAALALVRSVGAQRTDVPARVSVEDIHEQPLLLSASRAASLTENRGRRLGAAGAAGLVLAAAVSGAPALLPVALLVLAAAACAVRPRRRPHLGLALLPALAVAAPLLLHVVRTRDVTLLLADPLALPGSVVAPDVPGWQALLGLTGRPNAWFGGVLPGLGYGPYLLGGLLVVTALIALAGPRAAGARLGWFTAACGLALVVLSDDGAAGLLDRLGFSGLAAGATGSGAAAASLVLLGLGGAALCATRSARPRRPARAFAALRALGVATPVLLGLIAAAGLTSWYLAGPLSADGLHATAEPAVPAVGQQMQAPPRQSRVLQLGVTDDGVVEHALLRAGGTQLTDASVSASAARTDAIDDIAARLAAGTDPDVAARLAELGIGAVQVPTPHAGGPAEDAGSTGNAGSTGDTGATGDTGFAGDTGATGDTGFAGNTGSAGDTSAARGDAADAPGGALRNAELTAALDMVPGVERITQGQPVTLWRVRDAGGAVPGWARIDQGDRAEPGTAAGPSSAETRGESADGAESAATPLPSGGASVRTDVPPGDAGRRVVLAETAAPGWTATLDGRRLTPIEVEAAGATLQGFELGPDGGRLVVGYDLPHRATWLVALGLIGVVFLLLALPVGGRRRS
ncbi:glycosyltransferase [Myceligenerans crystallogenes]